MKVEKITVTADPEEVRKLRRSVTLRRADFGPLMAEIAGVIYEGDWQIDGILNGRVRDVTGFHLVNEEEVVLNVLEAVADQADIILNLIPLRKMIPVLERKMDDVERLQRMQEAGREELR